MNLLTRLLLLLALATGLRAETAIVPVTEPSDSGWTATSSFTSQYVFRGARINDAAFQPSLEYAANGLTLGVWSNLPFKGRMANQPSTEVDFYGSYLFELVKDSLSLVPGATAYTYPNAHRSDGTYRATYEPSLALAYTFGGLTLTPKAYYDLILRGPTGELTAAYPVPSSTRTI